MGKKRKKKDLQNKKIIEVQKKQGTIEQRVFENEVQELWKQAQDLGYGTLRDYLAHLYKSWDENQKVLFISQLYNSYLLAIQIGSEERLGSKIWGEKDTFRDWLMFSKKNIERRLGELKIDYEEKRPSFAGYEKILGDMEDVPGRVGESLLPEEKDFYELILQKSKETIEKVIKNPALIDKWLQKADELNKQM